MVIDTSAIVAVLWDEPERERFQSLIATAPRILVSAVTVFETSLVLQRDGGPASWPVLEQFLTTISAQIAGFAAEDLAFARRAFSQFGKGRHRAQLNFGDCFAYALAKSTGEPLLFKGGDFAHTDIEDASPAL